MTSKTCSLCSLEKPLDQFRRCRKDAERRHSYCRPCFNLYSRARVAAKRRGELSRFSRELADVRKDGRSLVALCDRMFQRFKGVDGLARVWFEAIQAAQRDGQAGRRFVLNSLVGVMRLVELAEAYRVAHKPNRDMMSEEELRAELRRLLGLDDAECEAAGEEDC